MPWAKVDNETGLVTDLFERQPTLEVDEIGNTRVIEVGADIVIGSTIVLDEETAPPSHEVRAAKPDTPEQQ